MLTIPTAELTGLISDVAPFSFPKDDLPDVNVIRLVWDGEMLHAEATDTMRAARSSWHPHDEPASANPSGTEPLFDAYGGADDPWDAIGALADMKELVKIYKLPDKEGHVPLQLDWDGRRLRVVRNRDTGHSAITTLVESRLVDFPDLAKVLDVEFGEQHVSHVHYAGRHLADFGTVRQRGTLRLAFGGPTAATRVTIGDRFVGTIRPERVSGRLDLRTASGLFVAPATT